MKRSLPSSTREDHYAGYLGEYLWRKRYSGKDMFKTFVDDFEEIHVLKGHMTES